MLKFDRIYSDGKYKFTAGPMGTKEGMGNIIKLENILENVLLKEYTTKDDETAIALLETLMMVYHERGEEELLTYSYKIHLPDILQNKIEYVKEWGKLWQKQYLKMKERGKY